MTGRTERRLACPHDFGTYDRSRTPVAPGGRAATPEDEPRFQRCPDQPHEFTLASLTHQVRGCSRELARIGSPPSARLQPVYELVQQACGEYDKGAKCWEDAARMGIPSSSAAERKFERKVDCGLPPQGRAVSRWPRLRSKPPRSKPPLAETLSHRPQHRPRGPDPWPGANSPGFAGPPGPHSARGLVWALALSSDPLPQELSAAREN
jgi:hypothetical protein